MKKTICLCTITLFSLGIANGHNKLDSALAQLDNIISDHEVYTSIRNKRISVLKERSVYIRNNSIAKYDINQQLYEEYKPYICDSAIVYLQKNLEIAEYLKDDYRKIETSIILAYQLGSAGMYKEASDLLETLERKTIPTSLLPGYYDAYDHLFGELAYYSQDTKSSARYREYANCYKDSLDMVLPQNSPQRLILRETYCRDMGLFEESLTLNDERLAATQPMTREYAIAAFNRAITMRRMEDMESYKYYLALSAISDIASAVKDHASLWMLADELYNDGDINRAYNYIRFSWDDTLFFNAHLRATQSSGILSLIDKTYQATVEKQNLTLRTNLVIISLLLVLLIVVLFFLYRQMRKLAATQKELKYLNTQLTELNDELTSINSELKVTNIELEESNEIKEEYIGRFIKLCSTYIDKLDSYRRMVNKKITNSETNELLRITRSPEFMEEILDELYLNFDTAFLRLFPNFVEQFNAMLRPEEQIVLKKDELLNTELRIFALIRLGIDDSSQIAEFLRYSVNTIYNYRAKVKNKAMVVRDDFETKIKGIR